MTEGKVWGKTQLIFAIPGFELHRIEAKQGGYCSMHKHESKENWFYVLSGRLRIEIEREGGTDIVDLSAGDSTTVGFGKWHRFHALEPTEALEGYWSEMNPQDIVRRTLGGISLG